LGFTWDKISGGLDFKDISEFFIDGSHLWVLGKTLALQF
jgi:hypothetical protein